MTSGIGASARESWAAWCLVVAVALCSAWPNDARAEDAPKKKEVVLSVRIAPAGDVTLDGTAASVGNLEAGGPAEKEEVLRRLRAALVAAMGARPAAASDGARAVRLSIDAASATPWRSVLWVMQTCADPDVRIHRFRLDLAVDVGLPVGWVDPPPGAPPVWKVALFRLDADKPTASTKIKAGGREWMLRGADPSASGADPRATMLSHVAEVASERPRGSEVFVATPPPMGPLVPAGDVLGLVRAIRAKSPTAFVFMGTAFPIPGTAAAAALRDANRGGASNPRVRRPSDASVTSALKWLVAHQSADGGFSAFGFGGWCDGKAVPSGGPSGAGKPEYDVEVTALSVVALVRAGWTKRVERPEGKSIAAGLKFLRDHQGDDGCFGPRTNPDLLRQHAIATQAFVEAIADGAPASDRESARKALGFIASMRNSDGGFGPTDTAGRSDPETTGWVTVALLQAARRDGSGSHLVSAVPAVLVAARKWLDEAIDPATGGIRSTGQPASGGAFPTATALAVLARVLLGDETRSPAVVRGARLCVDRAIKGADGDAAIDPVFVYAATMAAFAVAWNEWADWQAVLHRLATSQHPDGNPCTNAGSFDPSGPRGALLGRVGSTAFCALALESQFNYLGALRAIGR